MEERKAPKYTIETVWGRVLLMSYNSMPKVAEALERNIKRKALLSAKGRSDTLRLASEMLTLIARKDALVLARKITNEALENMNANLAYILVEKYVKGRKLMDIGRERKLTPTEMFRCYLKALSEFSKELRKNSYYDYWFDEKFKGEEYIKNIKEQLIKTVN